MAVKIDELTRLPQQSTSGERMPQPSFAVRLVGTGGMGLSPRQWGTITK